MFVSVITHQIACEDTIFSDTNSKVKSNRVPIREQLKQAADQLSKEKPKQKERAKEVQRNGGEIGLKIGTLLTPLIGTLIAKQNRTVFPSGNN